MNLVCIHVGKTGGVHLHQVLRDSNAKYIWLGHRTPLVKAATDYPSEQILIGIRHPVEHALSAYHARLRKRAKWNRREKSFFAKYPTADSWCRSLGCRSADRAFQFLGHVAIGLGHYFTGDYHSVLNRTWIYETETLSSCLRIMFQRLDVQVPEKIDVVHNAAPSRTVISSAGRQRLGARLSKEIDLYEQLRPLTLSNLGA